MGGEELEKGGDNLLIFNKKGFSKVIFEKPSLLFKNLFRIYNLPKTKYY